MSLVPNTKSLYFGGGYLSNTLRHIITQTSGINSDNNRKIIHLLRFSLMGLADVELSSQLPCSHRAHIGVPIIVSLALLTYMAPEASMTCRPRLLQSQGC